MIVDALHRCPRLRRLAPAVLLAAAVGCGGLRRGNPPPATIEFTNDALYQAAVYIVVPGAGARRIGTVFPGRTDTLLVPNDLSSRGVLVNIVARLIDSAPQTGPVAIHPRGQYAVRLTTDSRILSFLPAP